ncbi:prolipoprotein diacylglyceryl transferase [Gluconacetobacter azotocaptans]|uniref:Phosphatidylglycerol--prolipoprotein diacylglyceryl transferase n=1 Tax=Gluconacetobacter azotocaptans TaxID=142834 RepID=A0A7W4JV54_9PROT|nr:prolipoprotein diacylglyceryl transferase [Gluconacetobacter azotocaptans]MBB2191390.1 prolipoprotein diacylglyceryl transferase [Gluconacetobacter azotocaptans]MBM9402535.1 prolipoprotein diacylglyceryl transferase [Gluconacetobacter azotocaptans]GBQ30518.1 prolipoprotein diacylglyceryl transferase [Gluconacetobacter azotocaptans DSM 13594]
MLPVLIFPQFDPVMVHVGPLAIRWYAMAYIAALLIGWRLVRRLVALAPRAATALQVDDFLTWATLGVVLGGRLGYILFYQPGVYLAHPLAALQVWHGGMSFHGGALGVVIALALFSWRNRLSFLGFSDRVTVVVPMGLGLGRLANFINGELWGRPAPASLPWAMIFPQAGPEPRHPSELYEALLEGAVLFAVMWLVSRRAAIRERPGFLSGLFLFGYAVARSICEFFREPDAFIGFLPFGTTMGQVLCVPMAIAGAGLMAQAMMRPPRPVLMAADAGADAA